MTRDSPSDRDSTRVEIPDAELLAELRRVADELEESPTIAQMDERGAYSPSTYRTRFGSWTDAKERAGLRPTAETTRYSDAELLDVLRDFAEEVGETPTKMEMRECGPHAPSTYADRFGSWTDALTAADLEPRTATTGIPESELVADLRRVADELDRVPTCDEYDDHGRYSDATVFRRFDSWDAALSAAGIDGRYDDPSGVQHATDDLLAELRRLADVLGRPPTTTEMNELGDHSAGTYRRRFGSWNCALDAAGFDPDRTATATKRNRIPTETLLAELRRLAEESGDPPTFQEMQADGRHSGATYLNRFDSWNDALEAAGLEPRRSRKDALSRRELVRELRRLAADLGRRPRRSDMEASGQFAGMTYYNRFGSWENALEAAGLTTRDGVAALTARCDACGRQVSVPLACFSADDGVFCDDSCRSVWNQSVVDLERDVLGDDDDGRRVAHEEALGRLAPLVRTPVSAESDSESSLSDSESSPAEPHASGSPVADPPISELLYSLRYALSFLDSDFDSASFGQHRVSADGDSVTISRLGDGRPSEIRVERDTLCRLRDRIEAVESTAVEESSPAMDAVGDGGPERSSNSP